VCVEKQFAFVFLFRPFLFHYKDFPLQPLVIKVAETNITQQYDVLSFSTLWFHTKINVIWSLIKCYTKTQHKQNHCMLQYKMATIVIIEVLLISLVV